MDYCAMKEQAVKEQIMKSGMFTKARSEVVNEMPFDKDIIFIPVRTRKQAEFCFANNIEVYQRTMPNGMLVLCIPMDFETIINAISKYQRV